ncbi:methionine adenosyltransferase [Amygdalobacter nucleatus]|uniref:S-adenosylmethionine synthase n=1 Tax=Amygdalobacter nucleatus TaxID=3029274 RepID=A0A133YAC4_9FIRM|nr:methionine adenosyltransferase [Amygdalobacter nucleatus]KXB40161.1 methionine adenosyltransferase [Amygdalobacter nucleatus]MDF0485809.1 methionine adenosyltransferase [Amygdalobacter nucleatus]
MARRSFLTSESVTEGHPDKVCDQIADAILDKIYEQDNQARVACEVCVSTGLVVLLGEITTKCYVDFNQITRDVIDRIGYNHPELGFEAKNVAIITAIKEQSPDISFGVSHAINSCETVGSVDERKDSKLTGAGDQGMMFGYASDETAELMPLPIVLAHKLARKLAALRHDGVYSWLRPDGKTQVTVEYEDDKPVHIHSIVVSTQHSEDVDLVTIRKSLITSLIEPNLPAELFDDKTEIYINPSGRFVLGGPAGDSGLTGRKIIVDTYGGVISHGGGSFSGKDPTKVDRSAAYVARYIAKNIVEAKLAKRVEVRLAYAIGLAHPLDVTINSYGTSKYSDEALSAAVQKVFDLTPDGIINGLNLRRPIYSQTSCYGAFGRTDNSLPWEVCDKVSALQAALQ